MIDFEKLVVTMLRADSDIAALFQGAIYTDPLPQGVRRPVCRVTLIGGMSVNSDQPPWLDRAAIDFNVWGVTKDSAFQGAALIYDKIRNVRDNSDQTHGVLVYAAATSPAWMPDEEWPDANGQPGPRYHFTSRITTHPRR